MKHFLCFTIMCLSLYLVQAQTMQITGRVLNQENAEPLVGVNITVRGTNVVGLTDKEGKYFLHAASGQVLEFGYVGFLKKEITIGADSVINIELAPDSKQLDDVVVIGYGTQRKPGIATAVGSVSGKSISERGTVNPIQAVQGQVAGVDISATSGRAGAGYKVQIRGQNSLAGGQPLYVVDGVIVTDINFLNPQDIAKIDILKDAASTAIYGSRGSNGVVLITTKGGRSAGGKPNISYDAYVGMRKVARMPDFMDGPEWWEYRQNTFITPELIAGRTNYDSTIGSLNNPTILSRVKNNDYVNWRDLVLQTGVQSNHWLTVSGGSASNNVHYLIGAGYQNEKGNILQEYFTRYNFKATLDAKVSERWSAGMSFNFSVSETERGSDVAVFNAFNMAPIYSPYDSAGNLAFRPGQVPVPGTGTVSSFTSVVNPLLDIPNTENNSIRYYGIGNLYLKYSPVQWVDLQTTFSPGINLTRNGRFWGSLSTVGAGLLPDAQRENQQYFSYILDNMATIRKSFRSHSVTFTGLHSIQKERFESDLMKVDDIPFNSSFYNLGSSTNRQAATSSFSQSTLASIMGRIHYSFKDKYIATIASRWDGSSKLAPGHKWSSFPSLGLAWRLSRESFMGNLNFISDLKLRFSAGVAGNNNNISPYETQMNLSSPTYYDFGGVLALGYSPNRLPNPSLTWERTREYNAGLDFGVLNGRVSGSVDVYEKLSKGVLLNRNIPLETGYVSIKDNIGSVSNKGIEFSLRTENISRPEFTWSTTFNVARNENSIRELLNDREDLVGNAWFIGKPINVNYNYVFNGIWQENERAEALKYGQLPGQAKVKDLNNDGKISSADDRAIIGNKDPNWTGGFSSQITAYNFDFSVSMFARQGSQALSSFHQNYTNYADRGTAKLYKNYYMPANKITPARSSNEYPQPNNVGPYWSSIGYYKNTSFVKMQHILLGYTLPESLIRRVNVQRLRIYVNVLNPFVWTKYDGFDPEYAAENLNNTGVSNITYQAGINLHF